MNLELPMKADGRFGGHIVQGHVDGVGRLTTFDRIADSENWWLTIELPEEIEKYTVYKGSISIEGISLTVAKAREKSLHHRHHSPYGRDDEPALAEARRPGESGSRSDRKVRRENDEGGTVPEFTDDRRSGGTRLLNTTLYCH